MRLLGRIKLGHDMFIPSPCGLMNMKREIDWHKTLCKDKYERVKLALKQFWTTAAV